MIPPSRNPFDVQPAGEARVAPGQPGWIEHTEHVPKPWGHEEIFAVLEGSYVGKILHVLAGRTLSLQQHLAKDETIAVQSGRIRIEHGPDRDHLQTATLGPGDCFLIRSHVVHRISAEVDSVVLETSTAHPGWRTDLVRLDDRYGRGGTSTP